MARKFTMFAKFGDALECLDDEQKQAMFYAIGMYGLYGIEVELPPTLKATFVMMKEDIDNSVAASESGCKGGRPPKDGKTCAEVPEAGKGEVPEDPKPPVSETEKGGVSEVEKGGVSENPKANPIQSKPIQANPEDQGRECAKRKRFAPPARDKAADYAKQIGLPPGEVDRFIDHYASNGWRVSGKSPMRDWRASMRNWKRNMDGFRAERGGGGSGVLPEYASL